MEGFPSNSFNVNLHKIPSKLRFTVDKHFETTKDPNLGKLKKV